MTTGQPPTLTHGMTAVRVVPVESSTWTPGHLPGKRPTRSISATSLKAWIVRVVMLATTGFALFDLYLLAASIRH